MLARDKKGGFLRASLVGQTFHRLTVIEDLGCTDGKNKRVRCQCECGNITVSQSGALRSGRTKSCGCWRREITKKVSSERLGPKHHHWQGGRKTVAYGYIRIYGPGHHRADKRDYVLEHIVVMEQKISRRLLPGETVHHINGVRDDNRPENLELWDQSHHAGQRHVEKMAWHVQEIVSKASNEELAVIAKAIQRRIRQRSERIISQLEQPSLI